ncbi:hypothetical protein ACIBEA_29910 [Streptomyces sp. NPDC051555]|uniref:hypothetical protein n=1 Tax=Streptomyces sp. NPDC051555 TaxID=3365657 RepID=UPI0037A2B7A2
MSTAAQHPHLTVVPPPAAAPIEGVVVDKTAAVEKAQPTWLSAAKDHVVENRAYLPRSARGWGALARRWADRHGDDYPHMIRTARQALREAPVGQQAELKQRIRELRAEYRWHRLIHVGATSAWTLAGGTGLAVGTATGGLTVDLAAALGAYLIGLRYGAVDQIAAIEVTQQPPAVLPQITAASGSAGEEALLFALVKAGIISASQRAETGILGGIRPEGPGWAATIELPEGMKAIEATSKAGELASALRKKGLQVEFKPDSSETGHEGMASLWVADSPTPFAGPKVYSELINAQSWDFWRDGVPLGTDARQARQILRLIWSSMLIGGLQDYGKSYLARLIAAAAALDPTMRIIVITGKTGPDWAPLKQVAHRYISGSDPDTIREIFALMTSTIGDMQARGTELDRLFEEEPHKVPEGKITPEIAKAKGGMGPVLLLVEELQEVLDGASITKMAMPDDESENPRLVSAKTPLVDLFARFNRASRYVLGMGVYITQRPDAGSVPTELRDVCIKRASFRTKTRTSSEMVLGEEAVKSGATPHALLESSKGIFVLDEGAEDGYRTMRGDVIDLPDFAKICERGRQLRIDAGTLTGDAAARGEQARKVAEARAFVPEALAVMDERQVDRMRTETLATAMRLTVDELKAKLRAAGIPDPTPIGAIDGLQNPRGYKRDTLTGA